MTLNNALSADAIRVDAGAVGTDTTTICADIRGNTATTTAVGLFGIRARQRFAGTTFILEDYAGAPTDDAAVQTFLSATNNGATTSADHAGAGFTPVADCPTRRDHARPRPARSRRWLTPSSPRSGSSPTARCRPATAGRCATASCCRSTRTRRCSRCSARRSAATGASTSPCPTCAARVPIHVGGGHTLGERGGEQAHTLSIAEMPTHTHVAAGDARATGDTPVRRATLLGDVAEPASTQPATNLRSRMSPTTIDERRRQPGAPEHAAVPVLNFCIALQGIFPSPN